MCCASCAVPIACDGVDAAQSGRAFFLRQTASRSLLCEPRWSSVTPMRASDGNGSPGIRPRHPMSGCAALRHRHCVTTRPAMTADRFLRAVLAGYVVTNR